MNSLVECARQVAAQVAQSVKANAAAFADSYDSAGYWTDIYEACYEYLTGDSSITRTRNLGRKAVVNNFPGAFYSGYADGGGEETEPEDEKWLTDRINTELGFIDALFSSLKEKRTPEMTKAEADAEAATRAEGFRNTLNAVYNEGKLRGARNKMLTWHLGATEKHCSTCSRLNGQRHRAKWWQEKGYKPREPGSATLECRGYNCDCTLTDDDGNEFTL